MNGSLATSESWPREAPPPPSTRPTPLTECTYIITDSGTRFVFAEDDNQVQKLLSERKNIPTVEKVITFEGTSTQDGFVITLKELEELGKLYDAENPNAYDETIANIRADQLATLIYTSGTTGKPKGVELLHDCWVFEAESINQLGIMTTADHQYLWLPLSHSFGKVLEVSQFTCGFATTVDGRIPKLVDNLGVIKPTFMAAAPRIFEKVYNKVVSGAQQAGGLKLKIFNGAVKVGREVSALRQQGKEPKGLLAIKYKVADKLVFSKLKARFGGRIRYFISGSAPLSREMAEFFHAADILILEGYGLTETSAASFVNRPDEYKFGTVGPPLPGVEVKIAESDGEILIKGRGVMRGYHNLPDVTAETLKDGWLCTGDIGELDGNLLKITDRKKDLIKTSGGKYVAPAHLEGSLKAKCPYIGQVLVHGDRRNFCTALVTIDEEGIVQWAKESGVAGDYAALVKSQEVFDLIQDAVDSLNRGLAKYETIKMFAILPKDLTVEDGELTPSLKVKRKVVEKKYQHLLDGFYADSIQQL